MSKCKVWKCKVCGMIDLRVGEENKNGHNCLSCYTRGCYEEVEINIDKKTTFFSVSSFGYGYRYDEYEEVKIDSDKITTSHLRRAWLNMTECKASKCKKCGVIHLTNMNGRECSRCGNNYNFEEFEIDVTEKIRLFAFARKDLAYIFIKEFLTIRPDYYDDDFGAIEMCDHLKSAYNLSDDIYEIASIFNADGHYYDDHGLGIWDFSACREYPMLYYSEYSSMFKKTTLNKREEIDNDVRSALLAIIKTVKTLKKSFILDHLILRKRFYCYHEKENLRFVHTLDELKAMRKEAQVECDREREEEDRKRENEWQEKRRKIMNSVRSQTVDLLTKY